MQAILALEDGRIFRGHGYGAPGECQGEVVFNTSLTGYQEIATDPSYAGQIVVLTNPQIGNYGTNQADNEAARPYIEGLIVREFSPISSNWRSEQVTDEYMERYSVPVLAEIDTRALVRHLRTHGVMRGVISTVETNPEVLVQKAKSIRKMDGTDLARVVSTKSMYEFDSSDPRNQSDDPLLSGAHFQDENAGKRLHVVAYDFGIKQNILRMLTREGCRITVVPAETTAEDVLGLKPDGVFLSNGPGDPEPVDYAVRAIRKFMGKVPVFGICLGHQLTGLALGGRTYKLKFGHHGGNHPVRNNVTGKVEITAHNHNFAVDPDSINANEVELTHVDLNDQTLEGLRHKTLPLFSVQYHPEAAPGPHDSHYLFRDFRKLMEEWKG
ncbi:MAG: glutamine-hydrolyzing carbamoyl-phosphate synthase small subunit [Acidobacteriota bacterium]|nr:glutamine-hydrolyzing carbamoyl-phosphate synthase small subunit [Acidobacteriota bacterium]